MLESLCLKRQSFPRGLKPSLQAELICHDEYSTLAQYINTAIHLDNLIHYQPPQPWSRVLLLNPTMPEPMQNGCSRAPPHAQRDPPPRQLLGAYPLHFQLPVPIHHSDSVSSFPALVDSRSAVNLIHSQLVEVFPLLTQLILVISGSVIMTIRSHRTLRTFPVTLQPWKVQTPHNLFTFLKNIQILRRSLIKSMCQNSLLTAHWTVPLNSSRTPPCTRAVSIILLHPRQCRFIIRRPRRQYS